MWVEIKGVRELVSIELVLNALKRENSILGMLKVCYILARRVRRIDCDKRR